MKLLPIGLILLLALGLAACGCDDDGDHDDDSAALFSVIYDGPPTWAEVEWTRLNSHLGSTYDSVVRVELHGDFLRLVQKNGRVLLWKNAVHVNVRPHQLGPPPKLK